MTILEKALRFELAHASSEDEVTRLVALLGDNVAGVTTRATLSSSWVLSQQDGPATIAKWSVENCHDPETLQAVALASALRASVRSALLSNKDLPASSRTWLESGVSPDLSLSRRRSNLRASLRKLMTKRSPQQSHRTKMYEVLRALIEMGETHWVDTVIKETSLRKHTWFIQEYMVYYYLPDSYSSSEHADIYAHATLSPQELLEWMGEPLRRIVAPNVVRRVIESDTPPRCYVDSELFDAARECFSPSLHHCHQSLHAWLAPRDVEKVMADFRWAHLAKLSDLSDADVRHLAATTYEECPGRLASLLVTEQDFTRIELIISLVPDYDTLEVQCGVADKMLLAAANVSQELLSQVILRLSLRDTLYALSGDMDHDQDNNSYWRTPPLAWVAPLAEHLMSPSGYSPSVAISSKELRTEGVASLLQALRYMPIEYQQELLLHVPGLAARLVDDPQISLTDAGHFVYEQLCVFANPNGAALTMLYEHPEASLKVIKEICQRLPM